MKQLATEIVRAIVGQNDFIDLPDGHGRRVRIGAGELITRVLGLLERDAALALLLPSPDLDVAALLVKNELGAIL